MAVDFRIDEEKSDLLSEYDTVPIAFEVNSRFRVERVSVECANRVVVKYSG